MCINQNRSFDSLLRNWKIAFSQDFIKTLTDDSAEEERSHRLRMERRKSLMEKLERAMIDIGVVEDTQGADDTEVSVDNLVLRGLFDLSNLSVHLLPVF